MSSSIFGHAKRQLRWYFLVQDLGELSKHSFLLPSSERECGIFFVTNLLGKEQCRRKFKLKIILNIGSRVSWNFLRTKLLFSLDYICYRFLPMRCMCFFIFLFHMKIPANNVPLQWDTGHSQHRKVSSTAQKWKNSSLHHHSLYFPPLAFSHQKENLIDWFMTVDSDLISDTEQ